MSGKPHLKSWGFPVLIAFLLAAIVFFIWFPIRQIDSYPIGGGSHKDSPNGAFQASASNMEYNESNKMIGFYEFKISSKIDGRNIIVHRIHDLDQEIQFRRGNGQIFWAYDSRSVQFGNSDVILWGYTIPDE